MTSFYLLKFAPPLHWQLSSPGFTHIYAALVAIINTKLPENGELVLKRVVHGFKRAYKVGVVPGTDQFRQLFFEV